MLVLGDDLCDAYRLATEACRDAQCGVVILAACDADSVCASHILATLLRMERVPYTVLPVPTYQELAGAVRAHDHVVVLLNCGGGVPLHEVLERVPDTLLVLDSHRPYHLDNVAHPGITLLDDASEEVAYPDPDTATDAALRRYYEGTYYGTSAAALLYRLAQQVSADHNDLLWCALVGQADQLVHGRCSASVYSAAVLDMRQEVAAKNVEPEGRGDPDQGFLDLEGAAEGRLAYSADELAFPLLRHWSLKLAMQHSTYVGTRLAVWTDQGKRVLNSLLAHMGIPLRESCMQYRVMNPVCKAELRDRLHQYAGACGLDPRHMLLASFTRAYPHDLLVSAVDAARALSVSFEDAGVEAALKEDFFAAPQSSFWHAYDALLKPGALVRALDLAVDAHRRVLEHACALLTGGRVSCPGPFRYAVLEHPSQAMFPHTLVKLAGFLASAYQAQTRKAPKPFVLCCLNEARKTYLVVGVPADKKTRGATRK